MRTAARRALLTALHSHNHSAAAQAIQALVNSECLGVQMSTVLNELSTTVLDCMKTLGKGSSSLAVVQSSANLVKLPGAASANTQVCQYMTRLQHNQSATGVTSLQIRANLWSDVQRLCDTLCNTSEYIQIIQTVFDKKRRAGLQQLQQVDAAVSSFWCEVAAGIADCIRNPSIALVAQALETEYPKLLRMLLDVMPRVDQSASANMSCVQVDSGSENHSKLKLPSQALIEAIRPLETAYLSKSLSRMFDVLNVTFGEDSAASDAEVERMVGLCANELNLAAFNPQLLMHVCHNVCKSIKMFTVKCEQLLCTGADASQVIANPTVAQQRNVRTVNALHCLYDYVHKQVLPAIQSNTKVLDSVLLELDAVLYQEQSALRALIDCIQESVDAILLTMHQENFDYQQTEATDQQCSLYIRELQSFVVRVVRDHLQAFKCTALVHRLTTQVARQTVTGFIWHASLLRPMGDGGRLRLAADFAQIELAVQPLCMKLSDDLKEEYVCLRAVRQCLFLSASELCESVLVGDSVQYWLAVHLLIANSPAELLSPHESAGWSISEYVLWLKEHPDPVQRIKFLSGTMDAYARQVQSRGGTSYCHTYQYITQLLQRAVRN